MTASTTTATERAESGGTPGPSTYSLGPARDDDRYDYAEAINLGDWIPGDAIDHAIDDAMVPLSYADEPCDPAEFWVVDDFDPITDGLEAA